MQNRYTGDIGDYAKYSLLRTLGHGRRLGIAWYLFPDENNKKDGRFVDYLSDSDRWRGIDPNLYDVLKKIVSEERRDVAAIEKSAVLGNAQFSGKFLDVRNRKPAERRDWRKQWFDEALRALEGCEVVFADPDNGLCEDEKFKPGRIEYWKRLPLREAKALAEGRTAVIYHHNTRRPGGHKEEIAYWARHLGANTVAVYFNAYACRTFFVVNPTSDMRLRLSGFAPCWRDKIALHNLSPHHA